jgi:hypothetical protein
MTQPQVPLGDDELLYKNGAFEIEFWWQSV